VPIVTTDHADIPFVVLPGQSAFVARENDVESLAAALRRAVQSRERWPEMGELGRRFVISSHSRSAVGCQLEQIYDEAVG
jgi:glycosyltransferase involved in cell wall biosynthesis